MAARIPKLRRMSEQEAGDPVALARLLNGFATDTVDALTARLTFANMDAKAFEFDVVFPSSTWTFFSTGKTHVTGYNATAARRMSDGTVMLRGAISGFTASNTVAFATLPAGYWPAAIVAEPVVQSSVGAPNGYIIINPDGTLFAPDVPYVQSGTFNFYSLDGITYEAAGGGLTPLPAPGNPFPILLNVAGLAGKPTSVVVLGCRDWTAGANAAAPYPAISWDSVVQDGSTFVRVVNLAGLEPNRRYRVRLVVLGF